MGYKSWSLFYKETEITCSKLHDQQRAELGFGPIPSSQMHFIIPVFLKWYMNKHFLYLESSVWRCNFT